MSTRALQSYVAAAHELLAGAWLAHFGTAIAWNAAAAALMQGGAFIGNLVSARMLGEERYGALAIVLSTMLTVAAMAQVSMGYTATKFVAELAEADLERAGRVLTLCRNVARGMAIAAALVMVLFARSIAAGVLGEPSVSDGIALGSAYVLFSVILGFSNGALIGLQSFSGLARIALVQGVAHVALCALGAYCMQAEGVVLAWGASTLLRMVLTERALTAACTARGVRMNSAGWWQERHIIGGFAVPAALGGLLSLTAIWLGSAIVVQQSAGLQQMAYFGAASNLRTLVLFVPLVIDSVCLALLNRARGAGEWLRFRRTFWAYVLVAVAVAVCFALAAAMLAGPLMTLFGAGFAAGSQVLVVLAIATGIQVVATALYQLIQVSGRMWLSLFTVALPRDVVLVGCALALVPSLGAAGLALAYAIGWSIALLAIVLAVWQQRMLGPGQVRG